MTIENNKIEINGKQIELGMSFTEVVAALEDVIHIKRTPKEKSPLGYIKIKDESFYGLYGNVELFFAQNKLSDIAISPDLSKYDVLIPKYEEEEEKKKEKKKNWYDDNDDEDDDERVKYNVVEDIAELSENGLAKAFRDKWVYNSYRIGNMYIIPQMAKDCSEYAVVITKTKTMKKWNYMRKTENRIWLLGEHPENVLSR